MSDVVQKLCSGPHPVEITLRSERTALALKQRIEQSGFVHIKFTDTQGGTELGVRLDKEACDWASADFEQGQGKITLSGRLTLNFVPVRCVAEIDLGTLEGMGQLQMMEGKAPDNSNATPAGQAS
jgi:Core binding factor beta subunit